VEVYEPIELSFGVVNVVGLGIGVLDEDLCAACRRGEGLGGFGEFSPHLFEWHIVKQKCIRLV